MPHEGWEIPNPARLRAALNLISAVCEPGAPMADLGCLYGAYTLAFARAGYQATGIEARPENVAACRRFGAGVPGLRYIQDDARNIESHGPFDAVFCCGLLYHLDEPVKFLKTLGQVTTRLLIVQTHYAIAPDSVNEGYAGSWQDEQDPGSPWMAWGNERSFWLSKVALLAAIQDAGFDLVLELHDSRADICGSWSRGMFAGVKCARPGPGTL